MAVSTCEADSDIYYTLSYPKGREVMKYILYATHFSQQDASYSFSKPYHNFLPILFPFS